MFSLKYVYSEGKNYTDNEWYDGIQSIKKKFAYNHNKNKNPEKTFMGFDRYIKFSWNSSHIYVGWYICGLNWGILTIWKFS